MSIARGIAELKTNIFMSGYIILRIIEAKNTERTGLREKIGNCVSLESYVVKCSKLL